MGVIIVVAMLTIPSALAERYYGTDVILTIEQFEATNLNTSNNIRVLSGIDDVPQFMNISNNINLKNWFYWIIPPLIKPINCIVDITNPMARNYTHSINIPLEYVINDSISTWVEINSDKFYKNMSLSQLLSGSTKFDVDYDGNYTVTLYGSTAGGTCNAIATFIVDRTSEFGKNKLFLSIIIVLSLVSIAGYTFYLGSILDNKFKVLVYSLAVLFAYMALATAILVEREYIKVISINSNLDNVFAMSAYAATLIGSIMIFIFIINTILKLKEVKSGE